VKTVGNDVDDSEEIKTEQIIESEVSSESSNSDD
jgi:hypothetical protein